MLAQDKNIIIFHILVNKYRKQNNLSEMVFSKSMNAPPHMKRISFVSICSSSHIAIRREIPPQKK